jgi:hypothetical protein
MLFDALRRRLRMRSTVCGADCSAGARLISLPRQHRLLTATAAVAFAVAAAAQPGNAAVAAGAEAPSCPVAKTDLRDALMGLYTGALQPRDVQKRYSGVSRRYAEEKLGVLRAAQAWGSYPKHKYNTFGCPWA